MVASAAQRVVESNIVAIIREADPETVTETVDTLRRDGVSTVETTANIEGVLNTIRGVSESFAADEAITDVGIVPDVETTQATTLVGTEFIVTPLFDEDVIETVNRYGVSSLVDIAMPTEVVNAFEASADMVKTFPVGTLESRFISVLGGPLGHTPTVPTDGVGLGSVDEFFDADAMAVGARSSTVDTETTACGKFGVIEADAHVFREIVEAAWSG